MAVRSEVSIDGGGPLTMPLMDISGEFNKKKVISPENISSGLSPSLSDNFKLTPEGTDYNDLSVNVPDIDTGAPDNAKVEGSTLSKSDFRTARIASAGLEALGGVINAVSEYQQIKAKSRLNIMLANHQEAAALAVGKEASLREITKAQSRGEETLLAMAAQGQDVRGDLAKAVQGTEEIFGVYNAMAVEINSMRQAFGYRQEAILEESNIRQASIKRDVAITNSILQGGASVLGAI